MKAHRIIKNSLVILACLLTIVISAEISGLISTMFHLGLLASSITEYICGSMTVIPNAYLCYTSWEYPKLNK